MTPTKKDCSQVDNNRVTFIVTICLGVHCLKALNNALRTKWMRAAKTSDSLPWSAIDLEVSALAIFKASSILQIRNGASALFWQDNWINGASVPWLASALMDDVKPGDLSRRTVQEGLPMPPGSRIFGVVYRSRQSHSSSSCGL